MKKFIFPFLLNLFCSQLLAQSIDYAELCRRSKFESLNPIHAGIPGKIPFWNDPNAKIFKYAPAFDFQSHDNIEKYSFSAFSFTDKQYYTFSSDRPYAALSPIWDELPDGEVYLKVEAISKDKNKIYLSGTRTFYKVASFCPPYPASKIPYGDAVKKGMKYFYNINHIKDWYSTGKPNHEAFWLYSYSAKMLRGIMEGMLTYHEYYKNDSAIVIARKAADYLIAHSEPAGAPLQFFPQTYEGTVGPAGAYKEQMIMMEPSVTGPAYLELYKKTKDKKYYEAAINIANTYLKTQLPSGTWYIRINKDTGKPASDVLCIPIQIINFLTLMAEQYGQKKYLTAADKAMQWMWDNPMKTYNWTGQFEDVAAAKPFHDLTKYEAGWMAWYLMDHKDKDSSYLRLAKELISFCEDQFVVWSPVDMFDNYGLKTDHWVTPSAMEQYACYVPIDASTSMMVNTYLKAYKTTNDPMYREKAIALANSLVNVQKDDGAIPTFWSGHNEEFWLNCVIYSLRTLDTVNKTFNK